VEGKRFKRQDEGCAVRLGEREVVRRRGVTVNVPARERERDERKLEDRVRLGGVRGNRGERIL